jgi:hypothetical protein
MDATTLVYPSSIPCKNPDGSLAIVSVVSSTPTTASSIASSALSSMKL